MTPTTLLRCLLSPLTSWHALRLMCRARREHTATPTFDAAWRRARVQRHPDEAPYLLYGHRAADPHTRTTPTEDQTRPDRL
ncbi:hypothetical protein ACFV27_25605 [Streptomyces antimycoticus]|uniref:hypothetical protein n=1 Tax=Streptomyces antimycoticus TaxID=68175 RepID=UPI003673D4E9